MRIIQFADVLDYGDGIANDIWSKQEFFRELGYKTVVCALTIDRRLQNRAVYFKDLKIKKDDLFIHHYSGFSMNIAKIREMKCKKVMVYHNITPPEFMSGTAREHCLKGIEQLRSLGDCYQYFVGDSQFNVDCLAELGVTKQGDVLPITVEFTDKKTQRRAKKPDEEKLFLFVGRIAQNKKIENIIKTFDYYHSHIDSNSKLCIPGNLDVSPEYTRGLVELIDSLPSGNCIDLMGKISDEALRVLFGEADVYLSMSEHEGFGIPLLEAMNYHLPVLAYDSAAVAETLGNSGVLLKTNEPAAAARVLEQVLKDPKLQGEMIEAQVKNLERFKRSAVKERIVLLMKKWQGEVVEVPALFTKEKATVQGELCSVNGDRELTEQINQRVSEELQKEAQSRFASVGDRKQKKRKKRSRLSDYGYYMQIMEANKLPMEVLPENTRFKKIKQLILRMMNLVFQYQQQFNRATQDVLILMTRDLKSLDMRQQALEDKVEVQVMDLLERQDEEISSLKAMIGELEEQQRMLEAAIAQYKTKGAEQGKETR